jgi:transposase-like protein
VQRFTPLLADAARPCRHAVGDRWYVDETYVKVAGRWRYVYRAIDQYGQIIDVYVSTRRDTRAARRFFVSALRAHIEPTEVVTDRAWTLLTVVDELIPAAFHNTEQYCKQSYRDRPWPSEVTITADARTQDRSQRPRDNGRSCVRAEPPARPLRTRCRSPRAPTRRGLSASIGPDQRPLVTD